MWLLIIRHCESYDYILKVQQKIVLYPSWPYDALRGTEGRNESNKAKHQVVTFDANICMYSVKQKQ